MNRLGLSPVGLRLLAAITLGAAFLFMASVFSPHAIEARNTDWPQPASVDPHKGLPLLGTLEHACCLVRIYATDFGPRYSVYENTSDGEQELGVLLTAEKMADHFPELPVQDIDFGPQRQLMLAPVRGAYGGWDE